MKGLESGGRQHPPSPRRRNRLAGATACLGMAVAGLVIAGCGSSSPSSTSSTKPSSSTKVSAVVTTQLSSATSPPPFTVHAPSFNAAALKGKKVVVVPVIDNAPFIQAQLSAIKQVGAKYGISVSIYLNQGEPSQWVQGVDQAIAAHANAIILLGLEPKTLLPQLEAAKKAGIKLIEANTYDASQLNQVPSIIDANVPAPFAASAKLDAAWVIANSKAHAHALVIESADYPPSAPMVAAIKSEFAQYCGASCTATVENVPLADWATQTQSVVQSALVKDPSIRYVIPLFDGMVEWAEPAVLAAGREGQVQIATFNGTPFALKDIADGNIVGADVGESPAWIGWATMDDTMRLMAGLPAISTDTFGTRLFTKQNVSAAGNPPALNTGYGTPPAYVTGYTKLWHK